MPASSSKILVTGANGFIAMHAIIHLLKNGYTVRGTVRAPQKTEHIRRVIQKHTDTADLELVIADLLKDESWEEAAHGCDFVLHLASPFPTAEPKDENELIAPARDGTLRVLHAAHAQGVRRVVFLSSIAAVTSGREGENRVFDEKDWSLLDKTPYAYAKSKTLAEQAAWDFINSAGNKNKMELAVINPPYVFGPALDEHYFTSSEWVGSLLRAEYPGVTRIRLDFTDARDLAIAFLNAMTMPEAVGKRFCCVGASTTLPELALILDEHFAPKGYKVPTRILPDLLIRFLAIFDRKVRATALSLGWDYTVSTEQARTILGWNPRPKEQTLIDTGESLIEHGLV